MAKLFGFKLPSAGGSDKNKNVILNNLSGEIWILGCVTFFEGAHASKNIHESLRSFFEGGTGL